MCPPTLIKTKKFEDKIEYSDSFYDNNLPGWKENISIKNRKEIYQYVYEELLPKLFNDLKETRFLVVSGPSNEEIEYIKKIEKKLKIIIFEPHNKRVKELKEKLDNTEIINDYTFNIKKYLKKNSVDGIICLNIINWLPTKPLALLNGLYKVISIDGKIILSLYIDIDQKGKDKIYLIETPKYLKNLLENYSFENFKTYYFDSNGILKLYVISKNDLKKILNELKRKILEVQNEFSFFYQEKYYRSF